MVLSTLVQMLGYQSKQTTRTRSLAIVLDFKLATNRSGLISEIQSFESDKCCLRMLWCLLDVMIPFITNHLHILPVLRCARSPIFKSHTSSAQTTQSDRLSDLLCLTCRLIYPIRATHFQSALAIGYLIKPFRCHPQRSPNYLTT